jgi:hypothetical protein
LGLSAIRASPAPFLPLNTEAADCNLHKRHRSPKEGI